MKETDFSVLIPKCTAILEETDYDIVEDLGIEVASVCIAMIYYTNDLVSGFGQDYGSTVSVIASPTRISIVKDGHMSYYKDADGICGYLDVETDLRNIVIILQCVYDRWAVT